MTEIEAYRNLLSSRPESERYYECVTLSHSKFSKVYYLVNDSVSLVAKIPGGATVTFEPASMAPSDSAISNDLSQSVSFTIADIDNVLDSELDLIPLGDPESPVVAYSIYLTGYFDEPAQYNEYIVSSVPQKKGVFTVKAGAPDLNSDQTGEIFDFARFPPLRSLF